LSRLSETVAALAAKSIADGAKQALKKLGHRAPAYDKFFKKKTKLRA
jgi:hypothetical protein